MKYATRVNSFLRGSKDLREAIYAIGEIEGIDYIDLNYPEHFLEYTPVGILSGSCGGCGFLGRNSYGWFT